MEKLLENELVDAIKTKISKENKKIVVPEGNEIRVIKSLKYTPEIEKILIGNVKEIENLIETEYGVKSSEILKKVKIIDPNEFDNEALISELVNLRKGKLDGNGAKDLIKKPTYFATMLLQTGHADALVGGSFYTTADILRPAFQIIKPKKGTKVISSFFLMTQGEKKVLFSDCAVNINPTSEELKEITVQTIKTAEQLGIDPKVALLSYSTLGSGSGEAVDKVRKAYELLIKEHPELSDKVDGELQFDAAYDKMTAKIKAKNSKVAGEANVFIFPNLEVGNIGYKIAQFMGSWEAVGPLLQGLNKPVNDLSRGTTPETIAQVMYLSLR